MYNDASHKKELDILPAGIVSPAVSATAGLPKALYLASHATNKKHLLAHQCDWITAKLAGGRIVSDENNALKTGYDPVKRVWPEWVTRLFSNRIQLPEVTIPGTVIGKAGLEARELGLPASCNIRAGTTDSTGSFLATGVDSYETGVTTLGSTLVIKQLGNHPVTSLQMGVYSHRLGDSWLTGGASNTGGRVLSQHFSSDEINELSRKIDPYRSTGLNYYPLTSAGERFPENNPELLPRLTPRPDRDEIFIQGIMEGIAWIESRGYEVLNSLGCAPISRVVTAGGGSINEVWKQLRSRILAHPVSTATHTEAAYGTALLARHGTDLFNQFN